MRNINRIRPNTDRYPINEVGCFEKPVGMVLDCFGEGYSNLFYMMLKLHIGYNVKNCPKKEYFEDHTEYYMCLKKRILSEKFNVTLEEYDCESDLHDYIQNKLENDSAILIPGNLNELYYSKYFKKRDWPHLFLINGYDKTNKIYYTLDSTQFYKESLADYREFVLEYDVLQKIYESYQKVFMKQLYSIDCSRTDRISNKIDIVIDCLHTITDGLDENPYKEFEFIELIAKNISSNEIADYYLEELHRTTNAKKVFYTELINVLEKYGYDSEKISRIRDVKNILLNEWNKKIDIIYMNLNRKRAVDIRKELSYVLSLEQIMRSMMDDVRCYICNSKENFAIDKGVCFENNQDDIIHEDDTHNYIFSFGRGKEYSSWFKDDAPKVIIGDSSKLGSDIFISTTISIKKYSELSKFHAGIFIKTEQKYTYYWGTHCGKSLRMDLPGIYTNLFDMSCHKDEVTICVEISKKICRLKYLNPKTKKMECLHEMELSGNVMEVGVGCKTWDNSDALELEFCDTVISGVNNEIAN